MTTTSTPQHAHGDSPATLYAVPVRRSDRAQHVPDGRTLHLVDLENLAGGTDQGIRPLVDAAGAFRAAAHPAIGDHLFVGVNPSLGMYAADLFPTARLCVRGGTDGADLAILGALPEAHHIAENYHRVVVGSGDHIFASLVRSLVERGIPVEVVALSGSISRELAAAAAAAVVNLDHRIVTRRVA